MFRRSPADAVSVPFPEFSIPEQPVSAEMRRSYESLAGSLDFLPEELVRAQLLTFFNEQRIKRYDYAQVAAYLSAKAKKDKQEYWFWHPLRTKDRPSFEWGQYNVNGSYRTNRCGPYTRLVPHSALEQVWKIETAFTNKVLFFVSDYAVPRPDPFIAVRAAQPAADGMDPVHTLLVFDVWDEPAFKSN